MARNIKEMVGAAGQQSSPCPHQQIKVTSSEITAVFQSQAILIGTCSDRIKRIDVHSRPLPSCGSPWSERTLNHRRRTAIRPEHFEDTSWLA